MSEANSIKSVVRTRRRGRVLFDGMTLEQAHSLGYSAGMSAGRKLGRLDYDRLVQVVKELRKKIEILERRP